MTQLPLLIDLSRFYHNPKNPTEAVRWYRYAGDRMQRYTHTQAEMCQLLNMGRNELCKHCDRQTDPMPHCVVKAADGEGAAGRYFDPREVKHWMERRLG